jgi:hypothetical protein
VTITSWCAWHVFSALCQAVLRLDWQTCHRHMCSFGFRLLCDSLRLVSPSLLLCCCGSCSDRHELVRRQALALLANLLMKDYVKWRGPLFHR